MDADVSQWFVSYSPGGGRVESDGIIHHIATTLTPKVECLNFFFFLNQDKATENQLKPLI